MTAQWSILSSSFEYRCDFGCHGYDYESQVEAEDAEATHDCMFPHVGGAA